MKSVALSALLSIFAVGAASCDEGAARNPNLPDTEMKEQPEDAKKIPDNAETITLGAGCFWCVEAVYQQLEGVYSAKSGYMGGFVPNPTYRQVCEKNTGHIEVVQVAFDPEKISTADVLAWFWELHDPTTKDRQGNDVGPQYRSAIFYHSDDQKKVAEASMKAAQEHFEKPIVTEIRKAETFYVAEDYHQDYYFLNKNQDRYCRAIIQPKLKKLKLKD